MTLALKYGILASQGGENMLENSCSVTAQGTASVLCMRESSSSIFSFLPVIWQESSDFVQG